ncbi:MAG: GAF domain-containing protein [Elusimicrobia bacterium]|nr:GAF domain-containing protein [Elusimicrobiota bacterium]
MLLWILIAVCAVLIAALTYALKQLYALKSGGLEAAEGPSAFSGPQTVQKLEDLVAALLNLHEVGMSSTGSLDKPAFCSAVVEEATKLFGSQRASLMLWDDKAGALIMLAAKGMAMRDFEDFKLKPGEGIAGRAFETGESIYVGDPGRDARYILSRPSPKFPEPFAAVPVKVKNKPIGVLNIHATGAAPAISAQDLQCLNILAAQTAVTLENLHLYDDLQTFYLEMVQTLARTLDAKDNYTHDHSSRAKSRARALGEELKLPLQMIQYIEYASLLHDIGKIGIDESIIRKPGKLTPEEYEVMKKHPALGYQILAPVKFLGPVAEMVLYHQEWYNGQGYPEGLKGEEIPLGSRIVAIIDAWDAMTSDRPYRKALPRETAIDELQKGAGTQFDPRVVEAFLRIESRTRSPAEEHAHQHEGRNTHADAPVADDHTYHT